MANNFREKARKFKAVVTRLFTGCRSASNVDVVETPRHEEVVTAASQARPVQVRDGERELNVNQRAQLIVQDMIQQGLSYNDFDSYMERQHQGDLAVRTRTEVPVSQHALESLLGTGPAAPKANPMPPCSNLAAPIHTVPTAPVPPRDDLVEPGHTKVAAGTGPRDSFSVPNAPWSSYTIDGVAIPPHIQAVFARLTEMEANMGRVLGGDVALPHRKELPVFELPTNPTFPPPLSLGSLEPPFNKPKAVPTGDGVLRAPQISTAGHIQATENFKDVMDKVIASMAPGPSSAISVHPAKPALSRAKVALCISDLDKSMDRLYSNMTGPVRTSLPAMKLPVALGTVPTAPRGPATLKSVLRGPRVMNVPTGAPAVPVVPVSLKTVPAKFVAAPPPLTATKVSGAPMNKFDGPSVMPGGASSDSRPILPAVTSPVKLAPHTVQPSDMVTSVAIPKRWDIPVFMPSGASSDPRLIMPPGTSLVPPPGASPAPSAPRTVLPSSVAGMSKFQFAEYLMEQINQGALSLSEVDSLIDNFNANNTSPANEASTSQTSSAQADTAAFLASDPVLELSPLQDGLSLA